MVVKIGYVEGIFRYPVKSMRGERLEAANLGGTASMVTGAWPSGGVDDHGGFPWLTAGKLPDLIDCAWGLRWASVD